MSWNSVLCNKTIVTTVTNQEISAALTDDGVVYITGFVAGIIKACFSPIGFGLIQGNIIDIAAADFVLFFLTDQGFVYLYDYYDTNTLTASQAIYEPSICGNNPAIKIKTGRNHLLILTLHGRVWGFGDNSEYQLVPQGDCFYDHVVPISICDTNTIDGTCKDDYIFNGVLTIATKTNCDKSFDSNGNGNGNCNTSKSCNNGNCCETADVPAQDLINYTGTQYSFDKSSGTLIVNDNISGLSSISIPGNFTINGQTSPTPALLNIPLTISFTYTLIVCCTSTATCTSILNITNFKIETDLTNANIINASGTLISAGNLTGIQNLTINAQQTPSASSICTVSGNKTIVTISIPYRFNFSYYFSSGTVGAAVLGVTICSNNGAVFQATQLPTSPNTPSPIIDPQVRDPIGSISSNYTGTFTKDVTLDCCCKPIACPPPCEFKFNNIFAGANISVLLDCTGKIVVLGSLHQVRDNSQENDCMKNALRNTTATFKMPVSSLLGKPDISRMNVELSLLPDALIQSTSSQGQLIPVFKSNACDFISRFRNCDGCEGGCSDPCQTCENIIYLNNIVPNPISGTNINLDIIIINRLSIAKVLSIVPIAQIFAGNFNPMNYPDLISVVTGVDYANSVISIDKDRYFVDNVVYPINHVLFIKSPNSISNSPFVPLYVDISHGERIIKFTADPDAPYNIIFNPEPTAFSAFDPKPHNVLNYGNIVPPVELANLRLIFHPQAKLYQTYVRPVDYIKLTLTIQKQMITADVPTVFFPFKKIFDIAITDNGLSILFLNTNCPTERNGIFFISEYKWIKLDDLLELAGEKLK